MQLAREDLDADRPARPVAEQPVDDLRRPALPIARVAELGQRTSTALEVGGRDVVEHELAVGEVARGEALLDPRLALQQPVERGIEIVLIGRGDAELCAERRLRKRPDRLEL